MESETSSPGVASQKEKQEQAHYQLLQAFQSFRPRHRDASQTPQPLPTASQETHTNSEAATTTAPQETSSTQAPMTQEGNHRKRPHSSFMGRTADNEPSDSDALSRTTRSRITKKPRSSPSKQVEIQIPVSNSKKLENGHKESGAPSVVNGNTKKQGSQAPASLAASNTEGLRQKEAAAATGHQVAIPQSIQNCQSFATQLLNQNQKLAEGLGEKNRSFTNGLPAGCKSHLEEKLARATADIIELHQKQVDAVRLEFVAELQKDMDERQKIIDMLLQKPQSLK